MPRFAANLSWLFLEHPFLDRFAAAAEAGFGGVEVLFPYDDPPDRLRAAAEAAGVDFVLLNTPPPAGADTPGCAAVPGSEARFEDGFDRALAVARAVGAGQIHLMSGPGEGPAARAAFMRNLRWAAARAPDQGLTIEPINRTDMPGYFLADFGLALDILDAVGAPNLGLQFDAYHAWMIHGDVMGWWSRCAPCVRHVQIAGAPGRGEPGTDGAGAPGAIDYPAFFAALDAGGYAGWVSAEYRPAGRTEDGLGWLRASS